MIIYAFTNHKETWYFVVKIFRLSEKGVILPAWCQKKSIIFLGFVYNSPT